jgi:hypothetical protein
MASAVDRLEGENNRLPGSFPTWRYRSRAKSVFPFHDAEAIRRLFVKLTGREPTAEEMEEARKVLVRDGDRPESEAGY